MFQVTFWVKGGSLFEETAEANERLDDDDLGEITNSSLGKPFDGGAGRSLEGGVLGGPTRDAEAWRTSRRGELGEMGEDGNEGTLGGGGGAPRRKSGID